MAKVHVQTDWIYNDEYSYEIPDDVLPSDWETLSNYDKFIFLETNTTEAELISSTADRLIEIMEVETYYEPSVSTG